MNPIQVTTLRRLDKCGVRYLVVGGQAMRARGIDRLTRDLDLWIARDQVNAEAMSKFLERVQDRPPLERLQQPNFKFTVGDPRHRDVDILTSVAGDPSFEDCAARANALNLGGHRAKVISAADLILVKEASAVVMDRDAADKRLNPVERTSAAGTAAKERRDIALLRLLVAAGG